MGKLFGKWTLCALAMLGGCLLLGACSDSDDSEGGKTTPEHPAYISEVQKQLTGTWCADADGMDELDLMKMNTTFGEDNTMTVELLSYDMESDRIDSTHVPMTYQLLAPANGTATGRAFLVSTPTDDGKEVLTAMLDAQLKAGGETLGRSREEMLQHITSPDTTLVWIAQDSLFLFPSVGSLVDSVDYYDVAIRNLFTAKMIRGRQSLSMATINEQRNMLSLYQNISEWLENGNGEITENSFDDFNIEDFINGNYTPGAVTRSTKTQDFYGHNNTLLRKWMSQVKDNILVRDMMIPGTHDTATYGMWIPYMWTFARTQEWSITRQWDLGIRCFDLRTRHDGDSKNGMNRMYHEFMSCYITLEKVMEEVVKKVKENPTEGAILMIKTESNGAGLGNFLRIFPEYFLECMFPGVSFLSPDPVATMNESCKLVKKHFYDANLLAKFSPDMTMKDLRGKVLVLLQNAPPVHAEDVSYPEVILDYIANWKENGIFDMHDKWLVGTKEQNHWEQNKDKDEEEEGYVARKTNQFREILEWCIENPKSNEWVYNAANGYFWDPWGGARFIPDYASYAMEAYPVFANDIARLCNVRGIVLMDYVGTPEFKRVSANTLLSSLLVPVIFIGVVPLPYVNLNVAKYSLAYYIGKAFSKWKYPHSQELINNIVEVNIPTELNTDISDEPIDYWRAPYRNAGQ